MFTLNIMSRHSFLFFVILLILISLAHIKCGTCNFVAVICMNQSEEVLKHKSTKPLHCFVQQQGGGMPR